MELYDNNGHAKPTIAIVMLNSPNISQYAHLATMTNYLYATRHGYDFIVERTPHPREAPWYWDPKNEYTLVWYKPSCIKKHLQNYEYVLYIDSDATFIDLSRTIEETFVERYKDSDISLVFQEDQWMTVPSRPCTEMICAGVVFAKRSDATFAILDAWDRAPYTEPACFEFRTKHPREQFCITHLRDSCKDICSKIAVFPSSLGLVGQYDSKWIVHLGGMNDEARRTFMVLWFESVYNHEVYNKPLKSYKIIPQY